MGKVFHEDMFGNPRYYVRGDIENCREFTIDLMWNYSALADFGSTNEIFDEVVLNLRPRLNDERFLDNLEKLCRKHGVTGSLYCGRPPARK